RRYPQKRAQRCARRTGWYLGATDTAGGVDPIGCLQRQVKLLMKGIVCSACLYESEEQWLSTQSAGEPKRGMASSITLGYCILLYVASYCCSFLRLLYDLLDEDCSPNEYSYTKASKVLGM